MEQALTPWITTGAPLPRATAKLRNRALVRGWLYVVLLVMFALLLVGGATRLTDSGLSITEWKPIHGVIPPLHDAEWQEEFAKYQQIPEYSQINQGMSLGEFKRIFWWEWAHRILARGVGVVFALPLLFFWATGRIERGLTPKLVGLLLLGGLQGAVGWWMVASGLVERTDVSQYRLATHLTLACLIFAAIDGRGARAGAALERAAPTARTQRFAGFLVLARAVQIYLGGLVAGLDAGMSYNTWPLMDGAVVPGDLLHHRAGLAQFLREPEDGAVRAPRRGLCRVPAARSGTCRDAAASCPARRMRAARWCCSIWCWCRRRSASPRC